MPENPEKKKTSWKNILIGVIIAAILVGLVGFAFWYFTRPKESVTSSTNTTKTATTSAKPAKTTASCPSSLTDSDKLDIKLWRTYTNQKYKLSFKYPETWEVSIKEDEYIELVEKSSFIRFLIAIGKEATSFDYSYLTQQSKEKVTISCAGGVQTTYNVMPIVGENDKVIASNFTKDAVDYLVYISYRDYGASNSKYIVEAYDLILKTIEFK